MKKIITKEGYTETITTPGYYGPTSACHYTTEIAYVGHEIVEIWHAPVGPNIWHEAKISYVWNEAEFLTEPSYYTKQTTINGATTTLPGYYLYDTSNLHQVWGFRFPKLGYYKHTLSIGGYNEAGTWVLAHWFYQWIPEDIEQVWIP